LLYNVLPVEVVWNEKNGSCTLHGDIKKRRLSFTHDNCLLYGYTKCYVNRMEVKYTSDIMQGLLHRIRWRTLTCIVILVIFWETVNLMQLFLKHNIVFYAYLQLLVTICYSQRNIPEIALRFFSKVGLELIKVNET